MLLNIFKNKKKKDCIYGCKEDAKPLSQEQLQEIYQFYVQDLENKKKKRLSSIK